jgi:hypothetical protein
MSENRAAPGLLFRIAALLATLGLGPLTAAATDNGFVEGQRGVDDVAIAIDGGWYTFSWSGVGPVFAVEGAFTFTAGGDVEVKVTDDFCKGDRFRIYDFGVPVGDTSLVATGPCPNDPFSVGPDAAFVDPTYSSGTFPLGPGSHSITIEVITNPFGSGDGYIRVDSAGPTIPLPEVSEEYPGLASDSRTGSSLSPAGNLYSLSSEADAPLFDFIAGAPGFEGGPTSAPVEAGAAIVYLGSTDPAERAEPDIVFTGESAHDRAGVAVAGNFDFDGDGVPDLLIGAEQVNRTGMPDVACAGDPLCGAGKVYLIYFDPEDYPNIDDPDVRDFVSLSQVGTTIPGAVFTGVSLGDQAGFAVAGGGPVGFMPSGPDVAIGAPGVDVAVGVLDTVNMDAGAVYLIFNNPANVDLSGRMLGTFDLSRVASGQIDGIVYLGAGAGDRLGFSIAFPGDVVEPAGEDLAMGAPLADPVPLEAVDAPPRQDAGTVFLASGGELQRGIIEVCDIGEESVTDAFVVDGAQLRGDQPGEQFGYSVAGGGDNLVDGEGDFVGGAPFYDVGEAATDADKVDSGRAIQTTQLGRGIIEVCDVGEESVTDSPGVPGAMYLGQNAGDHLGVAVAGLGEVTGAGPGEDIGLGAPRFDPVDPQNPSQMLANAGIVYVLEAVTGDLFRGMISAGNIGVGVPGRGLSGTEPNEEAGTAVAPTGDFDGDGGNDFATGSPGKSSDTGAVSVTTEGAGLASELAAVAPTADASRTESPVECDGNLQATVVLDGSASTDPNSDTDNDDIVSFEWLEGATALASGEVATALLGLGAHTITLRVTDTTSLTDTDAVSVTVVDTEAPEIHCPADVMVECVSGGALVTLPPATAADGCDNGATITNTKTGASSNASGSYGLGATVVTFTATDDEGNFAQCQTMVTVVDTTPPTVTVTAEPIELWPPNHAMIPIALTFAATDACDTDPSIVLHDVTTSEPDDADGPTDGHTGDDIQDADLGTPDMEILLRAERDGNGPGRVYTIVYRAADQGGLTALGSTEVVVPHDQGDGAPEPLTLWLEDGQETLVSWDPVTWAVHYDVIRGSLESLRVRGSNIDLGSVTCIEEGSIDTTTTGYEDLAAPAEGQVFFYLVQFHDGQKESAYGTETAGRARVPGPGSCN